MRIFALDRSFYKLYRQDIAQLGPEASERLRLVQGFERLRRRGISGEEAAEVAREFEPSEQTIRNWVFQADRDEGRRSDGLTSAEHEELRRMVAFNRFRRVRII